MSKQRSRVFCQQGPLTLVVLAQVFDREKAGWKLSDIASVAVREARSFRDALIGEGIRFVARSSAIAHVLTVMMKSSHRWCDSGVISFSFRKALAREASKWILENLQLVEPSQTNLDHAVDLWFTHYREDLHHRRAGFDDYVDAAMVVASTESEPFHHVLIDHGHLPFILGECKVQFTPHYLTQQ